MRRRKVLLISYLFPPVGGSGVQRALKFAKYLPEFGWDPVVLTVKAINYLVYDWSLLKELPSEAQVIRTGSLDPQRLSAFLMSNAHVQDPNAHVAVNSRFREGSAALGMYRFLRDVLAFPDPQIGWIPFAYWRGVQAIRKNKIDAIVAMMPPHSSAFVAEMLSRKTGVPHLLDLRDSWTDDPDFRFATTLHRRGHQVLERRAILAASAVTVYGEPLKRILSERYPSIGERIEVLTNGFDPADFEGFAPKETSVERYRIVYQGSLNRYHENSFSVFLSALRMLPDKLRNALDVVFVGRSSVSLQMKASESGLKRQISFMPYLCHAEALGYLRSAQASLLFIPKGDCRSLTGKLFEYLMVGHPILACVEPKGFCAEILRKAGHGDWITPPDDEHRLAETIVALDGAGWPRPRFSDVDQFSRRAITSKLAAVLDRMVAERPAH